MTANDRAFIKSLPRYPMEYVGKLPDAITTKLEFFELKLKDESVIKFKREVYKWEDGKSEMGYWILVP